MFQRMGSSLVFLLGLSASAGFAAGGGTGEASERAKVKDFFTPIATELSAKCPVAATNDHAAFEACRLALFNNSLFKRSLKNFVLWGRPPEGNINASLKEFKATQFGPDVYSGTYAPMWMFTSDFDLEYVEKEKIYRALLPAGFRNELDFGQYPYPFWHDAKKWTEYEAANTLALWIDPKSMKITQLTFFKRADKPQVARTERRHTPTFDGKWMWVDDKGQQQPAPMLFVGLYDAQNPHLKALDETYRKFALSMRDADCDSCHVPNNPDKMRRLVLLQTPLHAASEIERTIKDIKQNRMPLDDMGIEKPLEPQLKKQLLKDAEAFAAAVKAAKKWEGQKKGSVQKKANVKTAYFPDAQSPDHTALVTPGK